jgi:hypothetical protein
LEQAATLIIHLNRQRNDKKVNLFFNQYPRTLQQRVKQSGFEGFLPHVRRQKVIRPVAQTGVIAVDEVLEGACPLGQLRKWLGQM